MNRAAIDPTRRKIWSALTFITTVVVGNSCTSANPTGEIGAFATATSAYAGVATAALGDVNSLDRERKITGLAAVNDPADVRSALARTGSFDPLVGGEAFAFRSELLSNMQRYADGLKILSTSNFKTDIDAAAANLGGSVAGFGQTLTKVTTARGNPPPPAIDAGPITAVVAALGNAITEAKRREAIKKVVLQADPAIQSAMRVLADKDWQILSAMNDANLRTVYDLQADAYSEEFGQLNFEKRQTQLAEVGRSADKIKAAPAAAANLIEGANAIASAHAAIVEAVKADRFSSVSIAARTADLSGAVGNLLAFVAMPTN